MRIAIGMMALLAAVPAFAGPHDFVIQHAGAGGTTETAQPYIDQFLRYAEKKLKWPANSAKGQFFVNERDAQQYMEQQKPGFGILDPDVFLDVRAKDDLVPIASVQGENQAPAHLYVVVKDPKYKSLDDLKGKTLVSNHLSNPKYLSKIVFGGKIDAATFFQLQPTTSPLKGLKAVMRGEADATMVDDRQLQHMKELGGGLRAIFTSPQLPPTPVVALAKNTTPAERDAFAKMVSTMCSDKEGAQVCQALQITRFTPPEKAAYQKAAQQYGP